MDHNKNIEYIRSFFENSKPQNTRLIAAFVDDVDSVLAAAASLYESMIPGMAYLDSPHKPMAASVFGCHVLLAVYLVLKEHDVDVHAFGAAMIRDLAETPPVAPEVTDTRSAKEQFEDFIAASKQSQEDQTEGEFEFDAFYGDRKNFGWGMNVTSCAICSAYSKFDAMDLVPYMCATDDVISDRDGQGLRRTGSIAVGAHQCDFRYQKGSDPQHLAPQYTDKIRLIQKG
jgi:hypothetical protein